MILAFIVLQTFERVLRSKIVRHLEVNMAFGTNVLSFLDEVAGRIDRGESRSPLTERPERLLLREPIASLPEIEVFRDGC